MVLARFPSSCNIRRKKGAWRGSGLAALWAALALVWACEATASAGSGEERNEYRLRWSFVTVGSVVIEASPDDGEGRRIFELRAATNRWMDRFLRARTEIISRYDEIAERSLHYRRTENADREPETYEAWFRPEEGVVQFVRHGEPRAPIAIPPKVVDPLSIVFYFRGMDLAVSPGHRWQIPLTDGRRFEVAEVRFLGQEFIRVPAGRFHALVVEADLGEVRAVFQRPEGAKIRMWFSDDADRIPLRLESSLLIGHFAAELTKRSENTE